MEKQCRREKEREREMERPQEPSWTTGATEQRCDGVGIKNTAGSRKRGRQDGIYPTALIIFLCHRLMGRES